MKKSVREKYSTEINGEIILRENKVQGYQNSTKKLFKGQRVTGQSKKRWLAQFHMEAEQTNGSKFRTEIIKIILNKWGWLGVGG